MSAPPQRANLGGNWLREKVKRTPHRRIHGDFRITWRFDRRVEHQAPAESRSESPRASLPYLGDLRHNAQPLEGRHFVLKPAR